MRSSRRPVKIVATLGPAASSFEAIERLVEAGVDVFRLNFSHGTFEEHGKRIDAIMDISRRSGRIVSILQDLPGPKVRLGTLPGGAVSLSRGEKITLSGKPQEGAIPVDLPGLSETVNLNDHILLADGTVELEVTGISGDLVLCRVLTEGTISSKKGLTLPSRSWNPPAFTTRDQKALSYGLSRGIDYAALSFVSSPDDIDTARKFITDRGADVPLIAKIETQRALENIEAIISAADGVMVARGDLGLEIPPEEVPVAQRRTVDLSRRLGKPVIIATQMLGSMTESPRPSRAETADVSQAVWSGVDAVMLSEETAAGSYPVESVATMNRIIVATSAQTEAGDLSSRVTGAGESIAHAACLLARDLGASAIVAATESGFTARNVSRYRPCCPIIGLTSNLSTARRLGLVWGVLPVVKEPYDDLDDMVKKSVQAALSLGLGAKGSTLVCTAGLPFDKRGGTDLIRVITI